MKQFAIRTAKKAGAYLFRNFHKDPTLIHKRATAKELTTKYDRGSDALIIRELRKHYPSHNLLTEESGFLPGRSGKSSYTWIVDSLDGSTNFARGNPFFAVSIALMEEKELLLGVIWAPFLREMYTAEKNKGAFLNGKRIQVSKTTTVTKSYIVSCEGGDRTNRRLATLNALFHPYCKDLRKLGSAALEAAYVASGRADIYFSLAMSPWDVAAGVLLVEEAGGRVTDFDGKGWRNRRSDVLFTNGRMHDTVRRKLQAFR